MATAIDHFAATNYGDASDIVIDGGPLDTRNLDWALTVQIAPKRRGGLGRGITALIPVEDGVHHWHFHLDEDEPDIVAEGVALFDQHRSRLSGTIDAIDRASAYLLDSLGALVAEIDQLVDLLEERTGERDEAERRAESLERQLAELRSAQRSRDPNERKRISGASAAIVTAVLGFAGVTGAAWIGADTAADSALIASQTELAGKIFDHRERGGTLPQDPEQLIAVVEGDAARLIDACRGGG